MQIEARYCSNSSLYIDDDVRQAKQTLYRIIEKEFDDENLQAYSKKIILTFPKKNENPALLNIFIQCTKRQRHLIFSKVHKWNSSTFTLKILSNYLLKASEQMEKPTLTPSSWLQITQDRIDIALKVLLRAVPEALTPGKIQKLEKIMSGLQINSDYELKVAQNNVDIDYCNIFRFVLAETKSESNPALLAVKERLKMEIINQSCFKELKVLFDKLESIVPSDADQVSIYKQIVYLFDWERFFYLDQFISMSHSFSDGPEGSPVYLFKKLLKDRSIPYRMEKFVSISEENIEHYLLSLNIERYLLSLSENLSYHSPIPLSYEALNDCPLSHKEIIYKILSSSSYPNPLFTSILDLLTSFTTPSLMNLPQTFDPIPIEQIERTDVYVWVFSDIPPFVRRRWIFDILFQLPIEEISPKNIANFKHLLFLLFFKIAHVNYMMFFERKEIKICQFSDQLIQIIKSGLPALTCYHFLKTGVINNKTLEFIWELNLDIKEKSKLFSKLALDISFRNTFLNWFNYDMNLSIQSVRFLLSSEQPIHPRLIDYHRFLEKHSKLDLLELYNQILHSQEEKILERVNGSCNFQDFLNTYLHCINTKLHQEEKVTAPLQIQNVKDIGKFKWNLTKLQETNWGTPTIKDFPKIDLYTSILSLLHHAKDPKPDLHKLIDHIEEVVPGLRDAHYSVSQGYTDRAASIPSLQFYTVLDALLSMKENSVKEKLSAFINSLISSAELFLYQLDKLYWELASPAQHLSNDSEGLHFIKACVQKTLHQKFYNKEFLAAAKKIDLNDEYIAFSLKNRLILQIGLTHSIPLLKQKRNTWPYVSESVFIDSPSLLVQHFFSHIDINETVDYLTNFSPQALKQKGVASGITYLIRRPSPIKQFPLIKDDHGNPTKITFAGATRLLLTSGFIIPES